MRSELKNSGNVMDFRIADTFTDSLTRLTSEEQKLAKTTAFDLQVNPSQPSISATARGSWRRRWPAPWRMLSSAEP